MNGKTFSIKRAKSGDRAHLDQAVIDLVEGMRVDVYNAGGTLRFRVDIDRPVRMVMTAEGATTTK